MQEAGTVSAVFPQHTGHHASGMHPSEVGLGPCELFLTNWEVGVMAWACIANLENETSPNKKAQPREESGLLRETCFQ